MIKVLVELKSWLVKHRLECECHFTLIFSSRENAEKAQRALTSDLPALSRYGSQCGRITKLLGFPLHFRYKETIEGEL